MKTIQDTFGSMIDQITKWSEPVRMPPFYVNGIEYTLTKWYNGWEWRNEATLETSEDFGIPPFAEAWLAQQDALNWVSSQNNHQ